MPSMFLPDDVESAVGALLSGVIAGVNVASMGPNDFDDDGNLIFQPPCARTVYVGTSYGGADADNQRLTYDATDHEIQIWCAAENLSSKAAQRNDSKALAGQVAAQMAGARLTLADDGTQSEPVRLVRISAVADDLIGLIYIVEVMVPGIAQFNGPNA